MKIKRAVIFFLLSFISGMQVNGQVPSLNWVQTFGNDGTLQQLQQDHFQDMVMDDQGNIYVIGNILNNLSSNPWPAPSLGGLDIVVMKLDPSGNEIWAKQIGGPEDDGGQMIFSFYGNVPSSIMVDPNGDVIIVGQAGHDADLDPGPDSLIVEGNGFRTFIIKLNPDGELIWGESIGYIPFQDACLDQQGDIYIIGTISSPTDVDPSSNDTVWADPSDYNSGTANCLVKIDNDGVYQWYGRLPTETSGLGHRGRNSVSSFLDGIVATSDVSHTKPIQLPLDTVSITATGYSNPYLAAVGPNGELYWQAHINGVDSVTDGTFYDVTTDDSGNVYAAGNFYDPTAQMAIQVDFDPGPDTHLIEIGGAFLMKLGFNGSFKWVRNVITGSGNILDLKHDPFHNDLWVAGRGSIGFLTQNDTIQLEEPSNGIIFLARSDTSGYFNWAHPFRGPDGGASLELSYTVGVLSDSNGDIYMGGQFLGAFDFDPGPSVAYETSLGFYDIFILKMNTSPVSVGQDDRPEQSIQLYPNPSTGNISIDMGENSENLTYRLFSVMGSVISQGTVDNTHLLSFPDLNPGIYLLTIESETTFETFKLILK